MLGHFYYPMVFIMGLSMIAGPIGSLMIWRKMTFFGETLAHGTLVAFLIQYLTHWPLSVCMGLVVLFYALVLEGLERKKGDYLSIMPILSYGVMGLSLLITETAIKQPKMVYRVFLGDLLLTQYSDCMNLYILAIVIVLSIYKWYRPLLLSLFSRDLALLHYPSIPFISFFINILMGLSVTMTVQSIGMLLAMALLTLPALIASQWSQHPWQMMIGGSVIALLCSFIGFVYSIELNWPTGPTITVILLMAYILSDLIKRIMNIVSRRRVGT
jgi:zinc transport system permease protein